MTGKKAHKKVTELLTELFPLSFSGGGAQVVSNLKRFISKVKQGVKGRDQPDYVNPSEPYLKDLEIKDEMDTSVWAITKRALKLVAVLTVVGSVLIIAGRIAWYS